MAKRGPITWKSEKRSISDLNPAQYNPRQLNEKQANDLRTSLERFNLADPIVINTNNTIIGGHQRINILKSGGVVEVDVRVPDRQLDDSEERELNLRLNRNLGEWDLDSLANFDEEMLKDVGFDSKELDRIFEIDTAPEADDVPEQRQETNIKIGDLFQLGDHRLLCGDSTKKDDVDRLMNGEKADMVFTDPPYGVSYNKKNEWLNSIGKANSISDAIEGDEKSVEELADSVIYPAFCRIKETLSNSGSYYITAPQGGDLLMMMMMMAKAGLVLRHMLIWVKNNHVLGRTDYNYKHEPILFGWVGRHEFYGVGEHQFSVWEVDKPHKSDLHPTMKPIALIVNALLNSSKRDEVVVDLFGGSGSTLIACEQTSRKCRMIEIDPIYCQVIIDRWEKLTNKKAEKLNG